MVHLVAGMVHVIAYKHIIARVLSQARGRADHHRCQQRIRIVVVHTLCQKDLSRRVVLLQPPSPADALLP